MDNKRTIGYMFMIVCLMFTTLNATGWIGVDKVYADENHTWPTMNFENEARWSANNNNAGSAEAELVANQPAVGETSMQLSYQMNIGEANWVELTWTAGELVDLSEAGYVTFEMYPLTETSTSQTYEPLALKVRNGTGSQSNLAYNDTLLRMVPNEWNTVRIDLPEADAEKNNIREFIFIIGGKYEQLEGRTEVEYLIRNAQAHPKDPEKTFEAQFKDPTRWTAHNNSAGSVTGSLAVDEPTIGRTSLKIDLAMNPGVKDWVNYVWRPTEPVDLTAVKNLTFDVYPTTETGANQIYEPVVIRIQNNGSTIYEKNFPRLTQNRWNQVAIPLEGLERDQIDRIVLIVGGHYDQLEDREHLTYYVDRVQLYETALPVFYHDLEYLDQWETVGSSAVSVLASTVTEPVAQGEHAAQIDYVIDSEEEPGEGSFVWDISPDVQLSDEEMIKFELYPLTQTAAESEPIWVKLKAKVSAGEEVMVRTVLDTPLPRLESNQWNTVEIDLAGTELTHVTEFQLYMKSDAVEIEGRPQVSYILDEISSQQYDPAALTTRLGQISAQLPQLKGLFTQAEAADISTDYERIHLVTIEDFIGYALEDIAYWQANPTVNRGYLGRAAYVARVLERLYIEAEQALQSYLAGSADPIPVPRYLTSEQGIGMDGYSFLAETSVAEEETSEQRPVFFVGYGHNVQVKRDIPKLFDYGANIIQVEVGPSTVITPAAGWVAKHYSNSTAYAELVDDVAHQGLASIQIHNEMNAKFTFSQEVYVEPNTTYQLSAKVKGNSVGSDSGSIKVGDLVGSDKYLLPAGTYHWEEFGYTFTTGADTTSLLLDLGTEKAGETIWIDDMQITKVGSTENIVYNGNFEEDAAGTIARGYAISGYLIEKELLPVLDLAADHDIAVSLLLSPHYFPQFILNKWPELNSGNGQFRWFIEYVIDHPEARAIMQAYIETVMPLVKNKTAIHSLTLSNEPAYVSLIDDYNLPKWQAYLHQTHGSIEQLNARYQTSYSQFSEIAMPLPSNREATPLYYDWVQFNNQLFTGWHHWISDLVRQEVDDIPIHTKLVNPFYDNSTLRVNHLTWGIDYEQFGEFSDINGNDNHHYIGRDSIKEWVNYLSYMDLQGSMKQAPIFDSEAHFIEDNSQEYIDEQIAHARAVLWHGAIHGRSAATIWTWQRSYSNAGWMGSIAHRPDVAVEVGKVNLDLNRLSYEVKALQDVKPEIEILYSLTADIYSANHLASLDLAYEAANFTGHRVGFVTEKQLQQTGREGANILIIPNATHIDPDTLPALAQYIASGGTVLVMDADTALSYDAYGQPLDEMARTSVLSAAEEVDSWIEPEQLRDRLSSLLAVPAGGLQVAVKEVGTGNTVYGVEWRSTRYEDKVLLHLSNLTDQSKKIYLEINGDLIIEVEDLIANQVLGTTPAIELEPWHPLLVAIPDRWSSTSGGGTIDDDSTIAPELPGAKQSGVEVLVNGKAEKVGTATITQRDDQTVTTVTLDPRKLEERLAAEGHHAVVTILLREATDVVIAELTGQMIKGMEQKQAVLVLQTKDASYTLPAGQINIDAILNEIGRNVALSDIRIQIEIAAPTAEAMKVAADAANKGAFTLVVPPVSFTIKAVYGDMTVEVSKFSAYVERTLMIPEGIDPNEITTGVVVEKDGTVRHVPTQVKRVDGAYQAVIHSLTNSEYAVVWHPVAFADVTNHWSKDAVNDMGARMVIEGTGGGQFSPDRDITRGEFAAIIVRGLGLRPEDGEAPFSDVKVTDWYSSVIHTAYTYGLIDGYNDNTFRPNEKITREQAMSIIAKAMRLTGLRDKLNAQSTETTLQSFKDSAAIAVWAKNGVADTVKAGIVLGRGQNLLVPKGYMTRAEVATTIQRLLKQSGLI